MTDLVVVKESDNYTLVVSPAVEEIAKEPHFAVVNNTYNVVEFRTTCLSHAKQFQEDAEAELNEDLIKEANEHATH